MREFNRIKEVRKSKGYSIQKLADLIGCGRTTVTDWENPFSPRRIQPRYYDAITKIFNMPIDEIVWIEEHTKRINLVEFDFPTATASTVPQNGTALNTPHECQYCFNFSHFEGESQFGRCRINNKIRWHSDDCVVKGQGFSFRNTKRKK